MPVMRRLTCAVLAVGAGSALVPAGAHALDAAAMRAAIAPQARALGSASGTVVADLTTGTTLFSRNATRSLVPASNEKLLTTTTALARFGVDATLPTVVALAPGATLGEDGVVRGDLRLVGSGDPSLTRTGLGLLADRVRAAGVSGLTGGVVGDGTAFDGRRGGPASGYGADLNLGGSLGGLVVDHGIPGAQGPVQAAAAQLQLLLADRGIDADVKARALPAGAGTVRQAPAPGTAPTTTTAPAGVTAPAETTATDPTDPTATEPTTPDPATAVAAPADGVLARYDSPPMAQLVTATNVPSDNFYAEMLLKALGAHAGTGGTTAAGGAVVRAYLRSLGVTATAVDGSGLSRADRISPSGLLRLLTRAEADPELGPALEASLPVAGKTGTLRLRMRGTPAAGACHAKTGTLIGVSALSGVCRLGTRAIAFSIVSNGVSSARAKVREDRIVTAIARYGR